MGEGKLIVVGRSFSHPVEHTITIHAPAALGVYQAVAEGGGVMGAELISSWQVSVAKKNGEEKWLLPCCYCTLDPFVYTHNRPRASPSSRSSATTCPPCESLSADMEA